MVIRPPPSWGWEQISNALHPTELARPEEYWTDGRRVRTVPEVKRIGLTDLRTALL